MQWWEHSPPTNMAQVQILASTPYVDWVCCWFSPLLWEVFLQVLRFSPLLKNQDFQIPIWSEMHVHISRSSLGTPTVVSSLWVQNYKFYNNNKITTLKCSALLHAPSLLYLNYKCVFWGFPFDGQDGNRLQRCNHSTSFF